MSMMDCLPDTASMLRVARQYLRETSALRSVRDADPSAAGAALLCITGTDGNYPTNAASTFVLYPQELDAEDSEGATATPSTDSDQKLYGINLGSAVPPQGTQVVVTSAGGRFVFRFDG